MVATPLNFFFYFVFSEEEGIWIHEAQAEDQEEEESEEQGRDGGEGGVEGRGGKGLGLGGEKEEVIEERRME